MNSRTHRLAPTPRASLLACCLLGLGLASSVLAGGPIPTVVDENSADWGFLEEIAGGRGFFAYGIGTPPLGEGAAILVVDETGREIFGTSLYDGVRLDTITALRFSSYRARPETGILAPSLQINVDYDLTDGNEDWQGRLVYEPYLAGGATPTSGTWQAWNALDGNWWASGAPGNTECPQNAPCTWAEVLSAFPDAGVHATLGGVLLKAGGPWAEGFVGAVDALEVGAVGGSSDLWDFETATGIFADGFESGTVLDWSTSSP